MNPDMVVVREREHAFSLSDTKSQKYASLNSISGSYTNSLTALIELGSTTQTLRNHII